MYTDQKKKRFLVSLTNFSKMLLIIWTHIYFTLSQNITLSELLIFIWYHNILDILPGPALHSECLFTLLSDWEENCLFTCFSAVSSNVNNGDVRQAVISAPHPLAFTTGKGSRDVREAVSSGWGQLPVLRLITLGPGCERWCVCVCVCVCVSVGGSDGALTDRRWSRLSPVDGRPALVNY